MAMAASEIETMVEILERQPEMETTEEAANEKKKKKKEKKKGDDLEDMFSFDVEKLEKAEKLQKAKNQKEKVKKKKEKSEQEKIQEALSAMARIVGEEEEDMIPTQYPIEEEQEDDEPTKSKQEEDVEPPKILRCPSPNRSRQGSPLKSPKRESLDKTSMKSSAAAFIPGSSSPTKETSSQACLKASAAEFVPPGFSSPAKSTSLQASAIEFVPPGFEPKASPISDVIPPKSELSTSSTEACWNRALFTTPAPPKALSEEQPPAQKIPIPALSLNLGEASKNTEGTAESDGAGNDGALTEPLMSARLNVGSILGKVKQSLMGNILNKTADISVEPSMGKVMDKVKKIEEKEADNEAEREREAAIKAVQEKQDAQKKKAQLEMNETLMDCFLQAVKTRVKDRDLPIMGTTLYGKHMRACRQIGTSCDVKDSSFVWVRPFLESLEDEKLIKLKPEVKDPTVTWINRNHHLIQNWQPWPFNDTVGSRQACGPSRRR